MIPSTAFRFGGFSCRSEARAGSLKYGEISSRAFGPRPRALMSSPVKGVTKINEDDFGKIRIESTQLIESALEISLLDRGGNGVRAENQRRGDVNAASRRRENQ